MNNKKEEKWKTFYYNGEETNYAVSSFGRVYNRKTKKYVRGTYKSKEYHVSQLVINGKPVSFPTHRLVALTFIPNPNNHNIVDHIDRDKLNNHIDNLRWVTSEQNAQNRDETGLNHRKHKIYDGNISHFKPVDGTNNNLLVSSQGLFIKADNRIIIRGSRRNGYIRIKIGNKYSSAHRIVWETFVGPIPDNMIVDHINGIRDDNRLENLRVVSQSENMENAYRNGHNSKKEIYQYSLDGNFIKKYDRVRRASDECGVTARAISYAVERKGTCAGYFWSFNKLSKKEIKEIIEKNKTRANLDGVTRYDSDGANPKYYSCATEAAKDIGCSKSTICRCVKKNNFAKGYYWILDSQKDEIIIDDLLK